MNLFAAFDYEWQRVLLFLTYSRYRSLFMILQRQAGA